LNLNTHFLFGAAAAALLVGKPEAIVLAGLGSVIPDLDRPYWFIPKKKVAEEEYHRALLHNILALATAYLVSPYIGFVSPYLGLGLFSHLMLDSMTTVKDRGVEWLFPFTRMISRDHWSQAEVQQEPLVWMPWRRTYGPALNGHMLDTYVFLCSIGVLVSWLVFQSLHHSILNAAYWFNSVFVIFAGIVLLLFATGEYRNGWLNWSKVKRIVAIAFLAFTLLCISLLVSYLFSQGAISCWTDIPRDWLLRTDFFLNELFFTSVIIYALIVLRFIRKITLALANSFPALCTKMPSRDFIIDQKTGTSDVFV